jgi:hypothetical protein
VEAEIAAALQWVWARKVPATFRLILELRISTPHLPL